MFLLSSNVLLPTGQTVYAYSESDNIEIVQDVNEAEISFSENELIVNGKNISEEELYRLLDNAEILETQTVPSISTLSFIGGGAAAGAISGTYFIPGIGQVVLAATGAVVIAGVSITAIHWASKAIKNFFSNEDNMIANDIISNRRRAGIRREFPGEYLNKKFKDIKKDAKKGNAKAQKAKKLLKDGRFKK